MAYQGRTRATEMKTKDAEKEDLVYASLPQQSSQVGQMYSSALKNTPSSATFLPGVIFHRNTWSQRGWSRAVALRLHKSYGKQK